MNKINWHDAFTLFVYLSPSTTYFPFFLFKILSSDIYQWMDFVPKTFLSGKIEIWNDDVDVICVSFLNVILLFIFIKKKFYSGLWVELAEGKDVTNTPTIIRRSIFLSWSW